MDAKIEPFLSVLLGGEPEAECSLSLTPMGNPWHGCELLRVQGADAVSTYVLKTFASRRGNPNDIAAREAEAARVLQELDLAHPAALALHPQGDELRGLYRFVEGTSLLDEVKRGYSCREAVDQVIAAILPIHRQTLGRHGEGASLDHEAWERDRFHRDVARSLPVAPGQLRQIEEEWLGSPRRGYVCFCHGSLTLANAMRQGDGTLALIDWEDAGYGHPARDLGFLLFDVLVHGTAHDLEACLSSVLAAYVAHGMSLERCLPYWLGVALVARGHFRDPSFVDAGFELLFVDSIGAAVRILRRQFFRAKVAEGSVTVIQPSMRHPAPSLPRWELGEELLARYRASSDQGRFLQDLLASPYHWMKQIAIWAIKESGQIDTHADLLIELAAGHEDGLDMTFTYRYAVHVLRFVSPDMRASLAPRLSEMLFGGSRILQKEIIACLFSWAREAPEEASALATGIAATLRRFLLSRRRGATVEMVLHGLHETGALPEFQVSELWPYRMLFDDQVRCFLTSLMLQGMANAPARQVSLLCKAAQTEQDETALCFLALCLRKCLDDDWSRAAEVIRAEWPPSARERLASWPRLGPQP